MRKKVKKTVDLRPDHKYNSVEVSKLINYIMQDGKKNVARKIVYDCFDERKKQTKKDPVEVFDEAISNIGPSMEVRSRRVGGANYQIPREVNAQRRFTLALRWIIEAAKTGKGQPMYKKLAKEIIDGYNNEGTAVMKKENTHKMAEANKAFAHFAW